MSNSLKIVWNKNSTGGRSAAVSKHVFRPLEKNGIDYDIFTTARADTEANIADMQNVFRDHDTIAIVGGDGTKSQAMNAVLRSGLEDVSFILLPFGNYNDLATRHPDIVSMAQHRDHIRQIHPLTVDVNGEYWRHAPGYMTLGFTAHIAHLYDSAENRARMQKLPRVLRKIGNLAQLGSGYFQYRDQKLPPFHTSESPAVREAVTDILLLNNRRAGGIIRSAENYGADSSFGYRELDVSTITKNLPFGIRSLTGHAPADVVNSMRIRFEQAASLPVQTEGEFAVLSGVNDIFVYKNPDDIISVVDVEPHRR